MKSLRRNMMAFALAALLTACSVPPPPKACPGGKPMIQTQIYFGLSKQKGNVSPREWQGFVEREIAPRFPEGFTIVDGRGFWLSQAENHTISENSKVVIRLHDVGDGQEKAIADIIENYKKAFAQEAVLRVDMPVCAAF